MKIARAATTAAWAAVAVAALVSVAHLSIVRDRLLTFGLRQLRSQFGVEATVASLSYNLLTLDVSLRGVRAAAIATPDAPFLTADSLRVNLSWGTLFGRARIDDLEAAGLQVSLVRQEDGGLNLPAPGNQGTEGATAPIALGRMIVREASLTYRDEAAGLVADAEGIALTLEPGADGGVTGRLVVSRGPSVRTADASIEGTLEGLLTYDGASLSLIGLTYSSPLGRLVLDGRLDALQEAPTAGFTISGSLALPEIFSMLRIDPGARGTVTVHTTVEGPLTAPVATIALDGERVSWRHLDAARLRLRGTVTTEAALVDEAAIDLDDGTLEARGRFAFDTGRLEARAEWKALSAVSLVGPALPVSVGGRLSGRADAIWNTRDAWHGLELTARLRSEAARGGPETARVAGDASLALAGGEWTLREDLEVSGAVRVVGDLGGRLDDDDNLAASAVRGALSVSSRDVSAALPLLGSLGLSLPDWVEPRAGRLDSRLRVSGSLGSPTLAGTATLAEVRTARAGPVEIHSSFAIDQERVALERFRATLGDNQVVGAGSLDVASGTFEGAASFELHDLSLLADAAESDLTPSGTLAGRFELSGTSSNPTVRGTITGAGLGLLDQPIGQLSAELAYVDGAVTASHVEVQQESGGRLNAAAQYALATGAYALTARADAISVRQGAGADASLLTAVIDAELEGRGTIDRPAGTGRISLSDLSWDGIALGQAQAEVAISEAGATIEARLPLLAASLDAALQLRAPYEFTLEATARETDLTSLFRTVGSPNGPVRLEGQLSARVSAAGTLQDLAGASAEGDLEQLDIRSDDARLQLLRPASFRYDGTRLALRDLRLQTGTTSLEASGEVGSTAASLDLSLRGNLQDVGRWMTLAGLPADAALSGTISGSLSAKGALDRPDLAGQIEVQDATVSWPGYPAMSQGIVAATLAGGVLDVGRLSATWEGAVATFQMGLPLALLAEWLPPAVTAGLPPLRAPARLVGRIEGLSEAALAPFAGEAIRERVSGLASVQVDLRAESASLAGVSGLISLSDLRATVGGMPLAQARPTRVELAGGTIRVVDWTWELSGNRIDVGGSAGLTGDRRLDLRVGGHIDLRMIGAFVPGTTSAGLADVSLSVSGSLGAPLADGSVEIRSGELRLADPEVALSELQGRLVLDGDRLQLVDLRGAMNGGPFTVAGALEHRELALTGGALTFRGSGITLNVPEGMRTEVDSELTLSLGDRPRLTGRATVQRGAYREPLSLAAGLVSTARLRALQAPGGTSPTFLDRLELEVAVASRQDLVVDNNYGRMEIGLDVRLVGTAARPSVVGRATIREGGVLFLGGRTYQVERGSIDFTNPLAIVPDLDLSARTSISGYDVTLEIAGTPETVKAELSSTPALSQSDIASLLVTGRRTDQVGGAGTEIAREQVLGYLSGETLGFAARAVGLDTLRFERGFGAEDLQSDPSLIAGDVDPAARLTIAKQLSRFAELTVSQNLRESGQFAWIASFSPGRAVELRTISRDDRSRSYEVRHALSFAGPGPEPDSGGAGRAARERVVDVRFTGDPGATPADLRGAIRLQAGDRFDFYRWQEDRARLRARYLDRGYLEAQIRAVRADAPATSGEPGVVLEYEIDRGPLARLDITGFEPPQSLVDELKRTWSNAIFDEALRSDLALAVRRHLAQRNFLRAGVEVSLQPADAGEKRVQIDVRPGARTIGREVQFDGNVEVPIARLEALAGDEVGIWLSPATLARNVEAVYLEEGFLAARVTAGPIVFADDKAVLPVRIVEGPPFVIAEVIVSNVMARAEDDVRRAFGLRAGDRYTARALEAARIALEADYSRVGFNAAVSTIDSTVDGARAAVVVTLQVDEGPRQVLEAIAVDGARDVKPSVVLDALSLETGEPVNMGAWYEARRRLLNTGLFQRVALEAVPLDDAGAAGIQPVEARVALRRWPVWRLRYGLEVTDETAPASEGRELGAGASADLQRRALFGRPGTVGAALRLSGDQRIARGFLTVPTFFGLPVASSLFVSRTHELISESGFTSITNDRSSFTAEQRFKPRADLQVAFGYHFEQLRSVFADLPPDDPFSTLKARQARLTSTVLLDTRDDPFATRHGLLHSSAFEYAPAALGADARFVKYVLQQFVYRPIGAHVVAASGVRLGVGRGFGQRLISTERFLAGGVNTVRGYADDSLGAVDFFGNPAGGQATLVLNQEIRFPIYRWIGGAGFLDAGEVFSEASQLALSALDVGMGAGLRFSTPVGLFRLDLGVPVPRHARTPRWHFSFGQMF